MQKTSRHFNFLGSKIDKVPVIIFGIVIVLLTGVFVAQQSIKESQDPRKDASVDNGAVRIQFSPDQGDIAVNSQTEVEVFVNTNQIHTDGVQLVFDVITSVVDNIELIPSENSELNYILQEVDSVDHGFKVNFAAITTSPTSWFSTSQNTSLLKIRFTPKRAGTIEFNFDPERSGSPVHRATPPKDELRTLPTVRFRAVASTETSPEPTSDTVQKDDLYFVSDRSENSEFYFQEEGTSRTVLLENMQPGTRYIVTHKSKIKTSLNSTTDDATPVVVKVTANDSGSQEKSVAYRDLRASRTAELEFSFPFVALRNNTFKVQLDPANKISESSENNNSWQKSYEFGGSSVGSPVVQCNQLCMSNRDCPANQRCFESEGVKRCRLATNVTSTSCQSAPAIGPQRTCNQSCETSSDCTSGLTCWSGSCRKPGNLESTSCANPTTAQQALIVNGCNQKCASNKECENNLRCYEGVCRLATNPSSLTCSSEFAGRASTPYTKGGVSDPDATVSARPASSSTPSADLSSSQSGQTATSAGLLTPPPKPVATPEASPDLSENAIPSDGTVFGDIVESATAFISSGLNSLNTKLLGLVVAGIAGLIILAIILRLVFKMLGKRPKSASKPTAKTNGAPPAAPKPPAPAHPTAVPPTKKLPNQPAAPSSPSTPSSHSNQSGPASRETITGRTAPSQHRLFSSNVEPVSKTSMLGRLEKKGVMTPTNAANITNPTKTGETASPAVPPTSVPQTTAVPTPAQPTTAAPTPSSTPPAGNNTKSAPMSQTSPIPTLPKNPRRGAWPSDKPVE